jgi:hypothetical protein
MASAAAMARQRVLDAFRISGVTAPERARTLESLGLVRDGAFEQLVKEGIVRPSTGANGFYLDESAVIAHRDRKPSRATITVLVAIMVGMLLIALVLVAVARGWL